MSRYTDSGFVGDARFTASVACATGAFRGDCIPQQVSKVNISWHSYFSCMQYVVCELGSRLAALCARLEVRRGSDCFVCNVIFV